VLLSGCVVVVPELVFKSSGSVDGAWEHAALDPAGQSAEGAVGDDDGEFDCAAAALMLTIVAITIVDRP
jgi:hypothetical protein